MQEPLNVTEIINPGGASRVVLVCEHASNFIPESYNNLGLTPVLRQSHIAWDPGAIEVARHLSDALDATLVAQRFSRLLYDCNRPPESPAAMTEQSEIHPVPGNIGLSQKEREQRVSLFYDPFRTTLSGLVSDRIKADRPPVIVTIHSFTPFYNAVHRAVEVGILHDNDARLADRMLADPDAGYNVQRNQPYGPDDGVTHTLKVQAQNHGLENVMIEIRNDLVTNDRTQREMAGYLGRMLRNALPVNTGVKG